MIANRSLPFRRPSSEGGGSIVCAIAVFAAAFIVRMHGLGFSPYWLDEVTTIQRAGYSFLRVLSDSLSFHQLPTYFVLISWIAPFELDESIVRAPSAFFGALTCAIGADIGRMIGGISSGLTAGLFLAFSPLQVAFGQEARPHALAVFLITIALRGLIGLSLDPATASQRLFSPQSNKVGWATFFFGTLAAVNVLGVALLWALAAFVAMLVIAHYQSSDRSQFLRNAFVVYAGIAIMTVPSYIAMYFFVRASGPLLEGLDWIPPVTAQRIWSDIDSLCFMRISSPITNRIFPSGFFFIGTLVAGLFILGLVQLRRKSQQFVVLSLVTIFLPISLLAISFFVPIWLLRYLLWSAVPFFIIAGLGVTQFPKRMQTLSVAIIGTLAFVNLVPYYHAELKPRWDLAAVSLRDAVTAGDLLLVTDAWVPRMLNLYLSRDGIALAQGQWTTDVTAAAERISAGGRVQAVFGRVGQADHVDLESFRSRIRPLGAPAVETYAGLDIIIQLFAGHGALAARSGAL